MTSREPKGDTICEQNPRRISPAGARLTTGRAYFAQQPALTRQQAPPPQQSAEREVAFAVPTSARAATIINRYFIKSPVEFLFPRPAFAGGANAAEESAARRWDRWTVRADLFAIKKSGKKLLASRSINEPGRRRQNRHAKCAQGAALLVLV
jgi:hypothetical protein